MNKFYIDNKLVENIVYPQYKNFCGIASVIAVVNRLFSLNYNQNTIHNYYGCGFLTKRKLRSDENPATESLDLIDNMGMSNWDIIRLFNSVALDNSITPYSAILSGNNYINYNRDRIKKWLESDSNYLIFHSKGHYSVVIGYFSNETELFWILGDSSYLSPEPLKSTKDYDIAHLANSSDKYGFILLSSEKIHLFKDDKIDLKNIYPPESIHKMRLEAF